MSFTNEEIKADFDDKKRLPVTHRRGYGGWTDDVADDSGTPVIVPTPGTPDDRFAG